MCEGNLDQRALLLVEADYLGSTFRRRRFLFQKSVQRVKEADVSRHSARSVLLGRRERTRLYTAFGHLSAKRSPTGCSSRDCGAGRQMSAASSLDTPNAMGSYGYFSFTNQPLVFVDVRPSERLPASLHCAACGPTMTAHVRTSRDGKSILCNKYVLSALFELFWHFWFHGRL